jgi:hypothetical protein
MTLKAPLPDNISVPRSWFLRLAELAEAAKAENESLPMSVSLLIGYASSARMIAEINKPKI